MVSNDSYRSGYSEKFSKISRNAYNIPRKKKITAAPRLTIEVTCNVLSSYISTDSTYAAN